MILVHFTYSTIYRVVLAIYGKRLVLLISTSFLKNSLLNMTLLGKKMKKTKYFLSIDFYTF